MAADHVVKFPNFTPSEDLLRLIEAKNASTSKILAQINREEGPDGLKFFLRSRALQLKQSAQQYGVDDMLEAIFKADLNPS